MADSPEALHGPATPSLADPYVASTRFRGMCLRAQRAHRPQRSVLGLGWVVRRILSATTGGGNLPDRLLPGHSYLCSDRERIAHSQIYSRAGGSRFRRLATHHPATMPGSYLRLPRRFSEHSSAPGSGKQVNTVQWRKAPGRIDVVAERRLEQVVDDGYGQFSTRCLCQPPWRLGID
jgi:hypothetical protein